MVKNIFIFGEGLMCFCFIVVLHCSIKEDINRPPPFYSTYPSPLRKDVYRDFWRSISTTISISALHLYIHLKFRNTCIQTKVLISGVNSDILLTIFIAL